MRAALPSPRDSLGKISLQMPKLGATCRCVHKPKCYQSYLTIGDVAINVMSFLRGNTRGMEIQSVTRCFSLLLSENYMTEDFKDISLSPYN